MEAHLRVIDLGKARQGAAARLAAGQAIDAACRETGFFCVTAHGIPEPLIAKMRGVSRDFFDLPLAEKLRYTAEKQPGAAGYMAMGEHALARTRGEAKPPDLNELMTVGPVDLPNDCSFVSPDGQRWFVNNKWPSDPPGFAETWRSYYRAASALGRELLRLAALGLGLEETWFDDKIDREISRLSVREYPAHSVSALPGQLRAAPHTDFGALTLLLPENKPGGLQIFDRGGTWLDVNAPDGVYVVNIGDMMAQWTNHRWVSTLHRVANPPAGDRLTRRQSLVFFQIPNFEATVGCIPTCCDEQHPPLHAPISAGLYYLGKVAEMRRLAM